MICGAPPLQGEHLLNNQLDIYIEWKRAISREGCEGTMLCTGRGDNPFECWIWITHQETAGAVGGFSGLRQRGRIHCVYKRACLCFTLALCLSVPPCALSPPPQAPLTCSHHFSFAHSQPPVSPARPFAAIELRWHEKCVYI